MASPESAGARRSWRPWLISALVGLTVFLTPLAVIETLADDPPEVRITQTGQRYSALIAVEDHSVLLINAARPDDATSALGRLRRPWEPEPQLIIGPATDDAAPGIYETARLLTPETIIIAGLPGADPIWSRLESLCRERGVELTFVSDYVRIELGTVDIAVLASESEPTAAYEVVASKDGLQVAVGMSLQSPRTQAQIAVANGQELPDTSGGSIILQGSWVDWERSSHSRLFTRNQEVVTIALEADRLRVRGGELQLPRESDTLGD